jgi:hypothetical protein
MDIDGNAYWVWKEIQASSPHIVLMEAHPRLGPGGFRQPVFLFYLRTDLAGGLF